MCAPPPPSVVSKNKLTISRITRSEDSGFKLSDKTSSVVEKSRKCENRLSFTSKRGQYPYFHRCNKLGLGSPSRKHDSQWHSDRSRKTLQCCRTKGSVSSSKNFQNKILNRILIASDNATVVSYLNKHGGTHSWDICLLIWCILAYCNP